MVATDAPAASPPAGDERRAGSRRLVVAWQHPQERGISPIGILTYESGIYEFSYIRHAREVADFRPLLGFPDMNERYGSEQLFPLFAQRAMDPRRPDYARHVHRLGLEEDTSPWEQITRSGGRREGDTLQFLPVPARTHGRLTALFLSHGVRYMVDQTQQVGERSVRLAKEDLEEALAGLSPGQPLQLVPQPTNPTNARAILLTTQQSVPVGYVPDLMVEDLHRLLAIAPVAVEVEAVNGLDAPWHLRLLCRLTAVEDDGFMFFTGPEWESLAAPPVSS